MSSFRTHDQTEPTGVTRRQSLVCLATLCGVSGIGCGQLPVPGENKPRELLTSSPLLSLVRFSTDGKWLAAAGADGTVFAWSNLDDSPRQLDSGHRSPPVSLTWSPDGLLSMTDMQRGFIGWQMNVAKSERINMPGLPTPAVCVAYRPNVTPPEMVLGMRDGSLIFLGKAGAEQLKPDHHGSVKQAAYTTDGRWLITAGADGLLIWREAASRKVTEKINAHETEITRLSLGPNGQMATGDGNGRIQIWDVMTHKATRSCQQPDGVSGLGWLGLKLVSGGWDGSLLAWSASGSTERTIRTGRPIHDLATHEQPPQIATVGLNRSVQLWQLP